MNNWKERLRDLYLVENDDISSPSSIGFNWGSFLFIRKTSKPAHFYLATQDSIEEFIEQELDKAREEGYDKGVKDGMKGRVFKKVHITEEYRPFKNRGELEEFLKSGNVKWDEAFKIDKEAK